MMTLGVMTEALAKEVCGWKYESPYSVYNYPDWETCLAQGWAIADSSRRGRQYYAVFMHNDGQSVLCGSLRLCEVQDMVMLGLGLRPDLCGKGYGDELMQIAIKEYMRRFSGKALELDVRPFNGRAIKCYENNGFVAVRRYMGTTPEGETEFLRMRYCGG